VTIPDADLVPLRVARRTALAAGIVEFELTAPDGVLLPRHTAGAHLPVEAPNGMRRNYSIVNPPPAPDADGSTSGPEHYLIAVKREPDGVGRGGSASMVDELVEGSTLMVGAPVDGFPLVDDARELILIAGGIGITPILCMARTLLQWQQSGERADVPFQLHYLARDAASAAYADEVAAIGSAGHTGVAAQVHFDNGDPAQGFDLWPVLETPRAGTHVYCCGPTGLMDAVRDMTGHWNPSAIHFESFGVGDATQFEPNQAFQVRLARAGDIIQVAGDESILDALRNHGHRVQSSCESGTCGTCRTVYLEGDVEHRDMVLADEEKAEQLMVCVSRARGGELVLDL
jgi:phthalate 4,5-dioxygenase reductase subunit